MPKINNELDVKENEASNTKQKYEVVFSFEADNYDDAYIKAKKFKLPDNEFEFEFELVKKIEKFNIQTELEKKLLYDTIYAILTGYVEGHNLNGGKHVLDFESTHDLSFLATKVRNSIVTKKKNV